MARPSAGLSGAALFVAAGGLYLAYAGVRDVPLVDGLRALLRGDKAALGGLQKAQPGWAPITMAQIATQEGDSPGPEPGSISGDTGIAKLVGYARAAYPVLKAAFPHLHMGGWRPTGSVPNSRHPRGLAIDVSGGVFSRGPAAADATAMRVFGVFKLTPGARTFIWNRHSYSRANGWAKRPYNGPSPHTDHAHLDWDG